MEEIARAAGSHHVTAGGRRPLRRLLVAVTAAVLLAAIALALWRWRALHRAEAHLEAARSELARHRYEAAYANILPAVEFWPRRGDVRFLAARIVRRAARPDEALDHLNAAREELGDTEDIRLEQQLLVTQKGESSEFAEALLRQRAEADEKHRALILEALAGGMLSTFRIHRARETIDRWLKETSDDPRPYFWRGMALEQMGGYEQDAAIADYQRALGLDPEYDEARARLGRLLLKTNRSVEARGQFEELVRRRPENAAALVGLARARLALGEADAARPLLDQALKLEPDNVEGLRERGILALNDGQADQALPWLRRASELEPQDPYASTHLIDCYRRLGREADLQEQQKRDDALRARQERMTKLLGELQQRPNDPALLHEMGTLYLSGGLPEYEQTGLWLLQRALEAAPGRADTLLVLAHYFEQKNRPELARQLRRRINPATRR